MPDIIRFCKFCDSGMAVTDRVCPQCGAPVGRSLRPEGAASTSILEPLYAFTTDPDSWPVQGVDISYWNGQMAFTTTVKKCQFGFIRAGYGNSWRDPECTTYRYSMQSAGMEFGLFWFLRIGDDPIQHINNFHMVWKENPGMLPPVYDAEFTKFTSRQATTCWLYEAVQRGSDKFGTRTLIYTSPGWWNANIAYDDNYDFTKYADLWVANWTNKATPLLPYGFDDFLFWQWSGEGNRRAKEYGMVSGGDLDIDLNRFNGTISQFNARFGTDIKPIGVVEPSEPLQVVEPIGTAVVTASALNIRAGNSATFKDIGTIPKGADVPITEVAGNWGRIEGWIHLGYTKYSGS